MKEIANELKGTVLDAADQLFKMSPEKAQAYPVPGKWSAKEVIGHLIDSASNNHGRFVRAQYEDEMVFAGYDQNAWVKLQAYQEAEWPFLVALWRDVNLNLARIVACIPEEVAHREVCRHNLHQVAWNPVPEDQPITLAYFVNDYVGHLKHHLGQINN